MPGLIILTPTENVWVGDNFGAVLRLDRANVREKWGLSWALWVAISKNFFPSQGNIPFKLAQLSRTSKIHCVTERDSIYIYIYYIIYIYIFICTYGPLKAAGIEIVPDDKMPKHLSGAEKKERDTTRKSFWNNVPPPHTISGMRAMGSLKYEKLSLSIPQFVICIKLGKHRAALLPRNKMLPSEHCFDQETEGLTKSSKLFSGVMRSLL